MVKPASQLWLDLNREKYSCKACGFTTANKAHYDRHVKSLKHFLLAEFAKECPRDCKIVVASFLPFTVLTKLGRLGIAAVEYAVRDTITWYDHRQIYLKKRVRVVLASPRARTVYVGVRRGHSLQSLAFEI